MNKEEALKLLEITEPISKTELRQQYHMYALMYHPDKNASPDARTRFLEIKEAYDVLRKYIDEGTEEDDEIRIETAYHRILKEYLGIQVVDNKIHEVLDKILSVCEKQSIYLLEKMDERKFELMYSILKKYRPVFFLSELFYEQMEQIKERRKKEVIELYPTINELMQHMVYKLYRNDELFLVPLWHHELVYEDKKTREEFIVRCIPMKRSTGEDTWIDDHNNIHCNRTYTIEYVFGKSVKQEQIEVKIGDYKSLFFKPWELTLTPLTQTIRWRKEGISIPDADINNISNKADIFLYITLTNQINPFDDI